MARPIKKGLNYFPLDINFDDSVELFEAECGLEGFAILVKLWGKIYSNGYYAEWGEDNQLLFSKRINCEPEKVSNVVEVCLRRGIFNRELNQKYKILTSSGIQKRYLTACNTARRKTSSFIAEYLLLEEVIKENLELIHIDSEETPVDSEETPINSDNKPPNKIKENHIYGNKFPPKFETFYSLYPNRTEKNRTYTNWKKATKDFTPEQINQAAMAYSRTVTGKDKQYIKTSANFLGRDKPYLDYIFEEKKTAPVKREIVIEEVAR